MPPPSSTPPRTAGSEEVGPLSLEDFDTLDARRVAARERAWAWRIAALEAQAAARVDQVAGWPVGRTCPLGRLREAWVARRYGLASVVHSGAAAAGAVRPGLAVRVGRAIALYETFAEQRPPGWPANGPGALCVLAAAGGAERFAGDIARSLGLAKGMRAAALERDAARLERARGRAAARRKPPPTRFVFRTGSPRGETTEARRCRVRDAVLLAGGDPAAWPNAALAIAHVPELRAATQPRLLEPDRCEEPAHQPRAATPSGEPQLRQGVELTESDVDFLRSLSRPARTGQPRTLGSKFVATGVVAAAIELLRDGDVDMHGVEAGDLAEMTARARDALVRAAHARAAEEPRT